MSAFVVGQRYMSEREPELGLGLVVAADASRIEVLFPGTGEKRLYAAGTPALRRVQFRTGDTVGASDGSSIVIEAVAEDAGLLVYAGQGRRLPEAEVSALAEKRGPDERLAAGPVDPGEVFDLRFKALQARARFRQSEVRGFLGARIDLIPHQLSILREVSSRQIARVLLADDVGLGKTIEACLILQRLLIVGKVRRALVLVPESLVHQWFVELLRRFNLWFSIYDQERCAACEQSDPGENPFLAAQLVLSSTAFAAEDPRRREQVVSAGWDIVVIDEAHHLEWTPEAASPAYELAAALAARTPNLLLLTATPTQLGPAGHFARLRLLDPARYGDYGRFLEEAENFRPVAGVVEKIVDRKPLRPADRKVLKEIFDRDPKRLDEHLAALDAGAPGARQSLIRTLLDQHGTGRVMFRNTRAAMGGFPKRKFRPAPVPAPNLSLLARIARELQAEEMGGEEGIRHSFKDDPRIGWLASFLTGHRSAKVLLICRSQRKAAAIDQALQQKARIKTGLFHEGLPLVQRDRNAAWFAEPEGAQLLICSEIGSEGRNFQFAHHLVLFDLPLSPGLVEQRIGRLDRIGQTETIRVHVPCVDGSAEEFVLDWYHLGLDAIETPLQSGDEYEHAFKARVLAAAAEHPSAAGKALIDETAQFRRKLADELRRGRDRLLELNSFDAEGAAAMIAQIRQADADPSARVLLGAILDHYGVRVTEHENGDLFLDPSHAYVAGFPSIPRSGMLATFDRARALVREDLRFLSADHPLMGDSIDLLVGSPAGTAAFGIATWDKPDLLLEAVFVLEAVADPRWQADQFLAPTPVRVVISPRGGDLTETWPAPAMADAVTDAPIERFRERPEFSAAALAPLLQGARRAAEEKSGALKAAARGAAEALLTAECQRLADLQKVNDHVRPAEVALAREQAERVQAAIAAARLRLDSVRLIQVVMRT